MRGRKYASDAWHTSSFWKLKPGFYPHTPQTLILRVTIESSVCSVFFFFFKFYFIVVLVLSYMTKLYDKTTFEELNGMGVKEQDVFTFIS